FEYEDLRLSADTIPPDGVLTAQVEVINAGKRAGDEVVQLYITYPDTSPRNPIRQLRGFIRVHLKAGESGTVAFSLDHEDLGLVNDAGQRVVERGEYRVSVGGRQPVGPATGDVLTGAFQVI
ncbi:MAG: fibronectin type III-like domain-contianing protein, partial [Anaerolineae bacterium]|nr:fibronectin type III-like domain-contianing protein [Anaerolineae bacterium]